MKKKLISVLLLVLCVFFYFGMSMADSLLDFLNYVEKPTTLFGYSSSDSLSIKNVSNSYIDVESPVITYGGANITSYLFNFSTSDSNSSPVAYWCMYDISSDITSNGSKFNVSLDVSDLDKSETYYVYAIPIDGIYTGTNGRCSSSDVLTMFDIGLIGMESVNNGKDPCVNIESRIYGEGDYCDRNSGRSSNSSSETRSSADSRSLYSITSNATHNCVNNRQIVVGWNSFADVNIQVLLWYENEGTYKKMGDVMSNRGSFTFDKVFNGDHIVELKPDDGSTPINYTIHCLDAESPEVKPVDPENPVKPPVVGPKENILMIIIGTLILYIVYRFATRKRD